jgi:predicted DNA-binding transcriptional regulator AlpA
MHAESALYLRDNDAASDAKAANAIQLGPISRLLLRPAEAAACLGISTRLLWSLTKQNVIPALRFPGTKCVRYSPIAIAKWIEEQNS